MPKGTKIPITPEVLRWAIENSGLPEDEVARQSKVDLPLLHAWENKREEPNISQVKQLAKTLKRPFAFFLLPTPPTTSFSDVQFRHPLGNTRTRPNSKEIRFMREAARLQRALSWIRKELNQSPIEIEKISPNANPEQVASYIRELLGVPITVQFAWSNSSRAFKAWRQSFEKQGIYTFLFSMGSDSARGFSLWDDYAPAISVNTHWNTEARIFTIFHELGHLLTRSNSVCLNPGRQLNVQRGDSLERWCEKLAAAVLMPWSNVKEVLEVHLDWRKGEKITSLNEVGYLAKRFKVSLRAATLRLIENKVVDWDLYEQIPSGADDKGPGGGKGRSRLVIREDSYGFGTNSTFLSAVNEDLMTRADALSYLNVSDSDLYKIQGESLGYWREQSKK